MPANSSKNDDKSVEQLRKAVDITAVIILLEGAMNEPLCDSSDQRNLLLTKTERDQLIILRKKISAISKQAEHQLKSDPLIDFDQEKLDEAHRESVKKTHRETIKRLTDFLNELDWLLKTSKNSKIYDKYLNESKEILTKLLELMRKTTQDDLNKIINITASGDIYKLCRQKGILYIPMSQGIDPELGGTFVNDSVEACAGKCAGGVISWFEQCSKSETIDYPLYADKRQKIYQVRQNDSKSSYVVVLASDLKGFLREVAHTIKPNRLYYISAQGKDSGHAMGLRIRQDGIFEFFDLNYFHAFCFNKESLELLLTCVLMNYARMFGYDTVKLYEADILQVDARNNFLYPHKLHLIQASAKPASLAGDKKYREMIRNYYLACNRENKKQPQGPWFNNFLILLKKYIVEISYEEILQLLYASIKKINPAKSFVKTEANKGKMLAIIAKRLNVVSSAEFKAEFSEIQEVLTEYKKIKERLADELNATKEALLTNNSNISLRNTTNSNTSVILSLTGMSTTILQFIISFKKSETPVNTKRRVKKSKPGKLKERFTREIKTAFGIKTTGNLPPTSLVESGLNSLNTTYAQIAQMNQDESVKIARLIIATQNLIKLMENMRMSSGEQPADPQQLESYLAYEQVFNQKLSKHIRFLVGFINKLKLSTDFNTMEVILKHHFPQLTNEHIDQLINIKSDKASISQVIETIIQSGISEDEVKPVLAAKGNDYQLDFQELLKSLEIIIRHIAEVRAEYAESFNTSKLDPTDMTALVLHERRMARVEEYDNRLERLWVIRDQLVAECCNNHLDCFIELAKKIRSEYCELFPLEITLVDDFEARLNKMLGRGIPVILNDADKNLVRQLNDISSTIKNVIEQGLEEVKKILTFSVEKISGSDEAELKIQAIKKKKATIVIYHFSRVVDILNKAFQNPTSSTQLIQLFERYLKPSIRDNKMDLFDFIIRRPLKLSRTKESNRFYKSSSTITLRNVTEFMKLIRADKNYLGTEQTSPLSLMPIRIQKVIRKIINKHLQQADLEYNAFAYQIIGNANEGLLRLIPCLYKSATLPCQEHLITSMYSGLDKMNEVKQLFKQPEIVGALRECTSAILDSLIYCIDLINDPAASHQERLLTELKKKWLEKPPTSLYELIRLQAEISQIVPDVLINFKLHAHYVNQIYPAKLAEQPLRLKT